MKVIDILKGIKDSVYKKGTVFQSNWFEDMIVKDDGIDLSLYWLNANTPVVSRYIEEAISNDVDFYILNYKENIEEEKEIEEIPIPDIDSMENERILRAEFKINELVREIRKLKESK